MEWNRKQQAIERHDKGFNCAQSVACTYCDLFDVDESAVFRLTESYGLGCGMMEVCGALTGAFAVVGLNNSSGDVGKGITKQSTYGIIKEMGEKFREKNGSVVCRELKGIETKKVLRTCPGCIEDACELLEEYLKENYKGK